MNSLQIRPHFSHHCLDLSLYLQRLSAVSPLVPVLQSSYNKSWFYYL